MPAHLLRSRLNLHLVERHVAAPVEPSEVCVETSGYIDLYDAGLEPMWVYDLGLVGLSDGRAVGFLQGYSREADYDDLHFSGFVANADGTLGPMTTLEESSPSWENYWYQVPHKPVRLSDQYLVQTTTIDDEVSSLRGVRVRLVKVTGDTLSKVDHIDIEMDDEYVMESQTIPISETRFLVTTNESMVYLFERTGDTLTLLDSHLTPGISPLDNPNWARSLCHIVQGSKVLIVWDIAAAFNYAPVGGMVSRVRPVSYETASGSVVELTDFGPMGNFDPTTHPNYVGWAWDDIYDFIGQAQVAPDTAAWAWSQTNYPTEYGHGAPSGVYETRISTARVIWDGGTTVTVTSQADSQLITRSSLFQWHITDIAPLGGGDYAIFANPTMRHPVDRDFWVFRVSGGAIVEERLLAEGGAGISSWLGLAETQQSMSFQAVPSGQPDGVWLLVQGWHANPFWPFLALQHVCVPESEHPTALFVAASRSGIFSSHDGLTWSMTQPLATNGGDWMGVAYGDGRWVVVGLGMVWLSDDGYEWRQVDNANIDYGAPLNEAIDSVTFREGRFIAGGIGGRVLTSDDQGETWQRRQSAGNRPIRLHHEASRVIGDIPAQGFVASDDLGETWSLEASQQLRGYAPEVGRWFSSEGPQTWQMHRGSSPSGPWSVVLDAEDFDWVHYDDVLGGDYSEGYHGFWQAEGNADGHVIVSGEVYRYDREPDGFGWFGPWEEESVALLLLSTDGGATFSPTNLLEGVTTPQGKWGDGGGATYGVQQAAEYGGVWVAVGGGASQGWIVVSQDGGASWQLAHEYRDQTKFNTTLTFLAVAAAANPTVP